MECVYLDLGGGGMNWIIGMSGAWPKIFGWKLGVSRKIFDWKVRRLAENIWLETRCFTENIWFEIRKILDISGIIKIWDVDLGRPSAVRRPVFLRHFIPFALIMVLDYATICILSVRIYRF